MTTYRTGNPIGSTDPKDLYDNAENTDVFVNSLEREYWDDRFGRNRKTVHGMEKEFDTDQVNRDKEFAVSQTSRQDRFNDFIASSGYSFLGDYAAGIEITEYNQVLRDSDGEFWRLSGRVELPYTTTGDGLPEDGSFEPIGEAVLRQELNSPDQGAALIGRGVLAVDSIADLLALPAGQRKEGLRYLVKGYHAGSDVGGGEFYYDLSRANENNDGTVIYGFVRNISSDRLLSSQFGIISGVQNGERIKSFLEEAAATKMRAVFDIKGTVEVVGKVALDDRIRIESIDGLEIEIEKGCHIFSKFDIVTEHVTNLFSFRECNNITISGDGEIEVEVSGGALSSRATFRVFLFANNNHGPDNIKFFGPLRVWLHGVDGHTYGLEYAGYVIDLLSAGDVYSDRPAEGFECVGMNFNGSSGRIVQTNGALGAKIIRNNFTEIGRHFLTVGARSLGDATENIISDNGFSESRGGLVVSFVTYGTNDVPRKGQAKRALISNNTFDTKEETPAVFINATDGALIQGNVMRGVRGASSIFVRAFLQAEEIANGADSLRNVVIDGNHIYDIDSPLVVNPAPPGGTIENISYKSNFEVNCGDSSSATIGRTHLYEKQNGEIMSGELTDPVQKLEIDFPFTGGRNYQLEIDTLHCSENGDVEMELWGVSGGSFSQATDINYLSHRFRLSSGNIEVMQAIGANSLIIPLVSNSPAAPITIILRVFGRTGRNRGTLEVLGFSNGVKGFWSNNNPGMPISRVVLKPSISGSSIISGRWRLTNHPM